MEAIEGLSSELQVDPDRIRLVRVEFAPDNFTGPTCFATFYTPRGSVGAVVINFTSDGAIETVMPF